MEDSDYRSILVASGSIVHWRERGDADHNNRKRNADHNNWRKDKQISVVGRKKKCRSVQWGENKKCRLLRRKLERRMSLTPSTDEQLSHAIWSTTPFVSHQSQEREKQKHMMSNISTLEFSLKKKTFVRLTGTIFLRYRDCTAVSVCLSVSLSFCLSPNASGMHPLSSSSLDSPSDVERSQEVNPCVRMNVFLPKYVDPPLTHILCESREGPHRPMPVAWDASCGFLLLLNHLSCILVSATTLSTPASVSVFLKNIGIWPTGQHHSYSREYYQMRKRVLLTNVPQTDRQSQKKPKGNQRL